jgi:hypothetical protein
MVGGGFLKPQRPEPGEKWKCGVPAQRQRVLNEVLSPAEPSAYGQHGPAQIGKRRERRVQTPEPSAQRGRVGYAIGIFDHGRRGFPATPLYKIATQCLTACDQAVMAVGRREGRQEGERLAAPAAKAAANADPIMVFIMSLFAPAPMTDDRILHANRAAAQNDLCARLGPIGFEVVLRCGKRDKQYRDCGGPLATLAFPKIRTRAGPSPPE